MSGYTELRDLGVRFVAPDSPMPDPAGRHSPFTASWTSTVTLLADELRHLEAEGISCELDAEERMFRQDGLPRSDARMRSDGVRLTFSSKHGPLRYETNQFSGRWGTPGWQANLRAIALSLEALRKVDRYGVSTRGEQYRGWRQLTMGAGNPADMVTNVPQAVAVILAHTDGNYDETDVWVGDGPGPHVDAAIRDAQRATHPDRGGDSAEFLKVQKAKELLAA